MFGLGLLLGAGIVALWLSSKSFVKVEEGEIAVLTRFGKALRGPDGKVAILPPGLHNKLPWDHEIRVSLKEQHLDLSGDEHRFGMTSDGIVVRYDSALRFVPVAEQVESYLFSLHRPVEHMVGTFTCLLRNEIANFGADAATSAKGDLMKLPPSELIEASLGAYAAIRRERGSLQQRLSDSCRKLIGLRFGLRFDAIDVMNFEPPEELRETLHLVIQAKADAEAALFRAQGECQQRLLAAKQGVEIARMRASAVKTEMLVLGEKLDELATRGVLSEYVERRRAEVLSESRHVFVRGTSAWNVSARGEQ